VVNLCIAVDDTMIHSHSVHTGGNSASMLSSLIFDTVVRILNLKCLIKCLQDIIYVVT
jgi:hypothetical protein